jgi:hypothetical protein
MLRPVLRQQFMKLAVLWQQVADIDVAGLQSSVAKIQSCLAVVVRTRLGQGLLSQITGMKMNKEWWCCPCEGKTARAPQQVVLQAPLP